LPQHLTTKGYIDSIIKGLGFNLPKLPSLPMPPLPPGLTLPPGITLPPGLLPSQAEIADAQLQAPDSITWVEALLHRLGAIEARLDAIESRLIAIERGVP
jgi:hypothetical protein